MVNWLVFPKAKLWRLILSLRNAQFVGVRNCVENMINIHSLKKDRTTRKGWIKKLDKIVSEIVVARDGKCVTCNSTEKLGCGHLFTRGCYSTRWDLFNCNAQCWPCNYKHERFPDFYTRWFLSHYGNDMYNELAEKHHTTTHYKAFDLMAMYEELKLILATYKK